MGKARLAASLGVLCACGTGQLPDPNFAGTWNGTAVFYVYSEAAQPPAQVQILVSVYGSQVTLGLCPGLNLKVEGAGGDASWFALTDPPSCLPISVDVGPNEYGSGWACPSVVFSTAAGNATVSNNTLTINAGGEFAGCGTTVAQGTGFEFSGIK